MSLPQTGQFEAEARSWKLFFDGNTWTGTGPGIEHIISRLNFKTPDYKNTHSTCDTVATRLLDDFFPAGWTKICSHGDPPTYKGPRPSGWRD